MGSVKHGVWMEYLLSYYDNRHFINPDGSFDQTTNVLTITSMTKERSTRYAWTTPIRRLRVWQPCIQREYFCPKSYETGRLCVRTIRYASIISGPHGMTNVISCKRKKRSRYIEKYGADRGAIKISKWERRNFIRLAMMQLGDKRICV